ncbi:hypothetical protein B0T25DRAFT_552316 [Lasiosphaeria hispida]|uniref:NACHT-NTPase and P-loop NTPases N-terminal domain-containing protein n=1 Tax=Lasiosphaeria hispida TaxID=260671 RepID=A0AAJ0MAX9_9PEZI|nr:hypothetical protein B0T25DRAFT_552316 [Lasiosphaeria hispida]
MRIVLRSIGIPNDKLEDNNCKLSKMPSAAATQALIAIRGAISTLNNTSDVCADIDEAEDDLPEAFHEVAKTIPLVEHTLQTIKGHIQSRKQKDETQEDRDAYQEITDVANECDARAGRLEKICGKVIPSDETPLMDRYRSAAGKGGRVELLMKGILEGVIALAKEPFVSEDQAKALREALKIISKLPPSLQEENGAHAFYNYGSGPQSIHLGVGDQNINTGQAPQFNGQFMAPFQLGSFAPVL